MELVSVTTGQSRATLATCVEEHSGRDSNLGSEAAFTGWIDLARTESGWSASRTQAGRVILRAPGSEVTCDPDRVCWQFDNRLLTLVAGTPRIGDAAISVDQVHAKFAGVGAGWGDLRGRFCAVSIDLERHCVTLVTDRFGVLPVCWARDETVLAFSDRADAVPSQAVRRLDMQSIFNYVYFHVIPAPRTIFSGVQRLGPAQVLYCSASDTKPASTWKPEFSRVRRSPAPDLTRRFISLLERAVEREAGLPEVGAFLSGGTDSSTVAGMLCRVRGRSVPTFSIGFDAAGYDEMAYARLAARHFGTDHHEYYVTPRDLCDNIAQTAAHFDQPFGNSSVLPAFRCAGLAAESGIRKLLAGDGGDELFGGNTRYAKQKLFNAYWFLPRTVRAAVVEPLFGTRAARRLPGVRKLASYVAQARIPMPERTETYNLLNRFGTANVFTAHVLRSVDAAEPGRLQTEVYEQHADASFVDRMLAFDWRFTLVDNDLPKVTHAAHLAGLNVGFPLLDDDIVDLSLELGASDKVRGLKLRHFFKTALRGFLPPEIISKRKHGFGLPVGPWLVSDADFRHLACDSLAALVERGIINGALVDDLFSSRLAQHAGYYGEMVWILMMLEQWLRRRAPGFAVT